MRHHPIYIAIEYNFCKHMVGNNPIQSFGQLLTLRGSLWPAFCGILAEYFHSQTPLFSAALPGLCSNGSLACFTSRFQG